MGSEEFQVQKSSIQIHKDIKDSSTTNNVKSEEISEGWYTRYFRWIPSSPILLEQAERNILSYVKTIYEGKYVDIGPVDHQSSCKWLFKSKPEDRKIWTVEFGKDSKETPLVMLHGLCASLGLWAMNIDGLAANRKVYTIDLLGFGKSSRPNFAKDAAKVEEEHVEAIEAWRKEMNLERFVLLGHSMGGFISAAYALKYPERVSHLIVADGWGFTPKPDDIASHMPKSARISPTALKAINYIGQNFNALSVLRALGPMGPGFIGKARPDLVSKFEPLNQNGAKNLVADYIFHSNAGNPTGEEAFRIMMNRIGWAKNPMVHRFNELNSDVPLTMIYGGDSWMNMQQLSEEHIKSLRPESYVNVITIPGASHHVYADDQTQFNSIVNEAAVQADKQSIPSN